MTSSTSSIRILILHTDETFRDFLAETLRASLRLLNVKLDVFDGNKLDHELTLALLNRNYDFIFLNLRLPCGLAVRIAELAHLAKVHTRLVLTSGSGLPTELLTPLFDVYIPLPCTAGELESAIWSTSALTGLARTSLPTEEHVEAAIKSLVTDRLSNYLFGLGESDGFENYRVYFPQLPPAMLQVLSTNASLAQRLGAYAVRSPTDYSQRLARAILLISQSRHLNTALKLFLMDQYMRASERIRVSLKHKPSQTSELLDYLELVADHLAGQQPGLTTPELPDSLHRMLYHLPDSGLLGSVVANVVKVMGSRRTV